MNEFKILQGSSLISENQLEELSRDRWELVTIIEPVHDPQVSANFVFYFKRERIVG